MAVNKTQYTSESVEDFIANLKEDQKQKDSSTLIEWMKNISNENPKMFGTSIIGFGLYHYEYESGHSGKAPLLAFSPRKSAISLYVNSNTEEQVKLLERLGKFKTGAACIYVKQLKDIDGNILKTIMQLNIQYLSHQYKRIL